MRSFFSSSSPIHVWGRRAAVVGVLASAIACTPEIGDKCVLSTDCSVRGDRLCDNSQPGGYCTVFNCKGSDCPDEAACVLFNAAVQGCGFDDRAGNFGGRTARSFCVAVCGSNDDCRGGYVCADPRSQPWNGTILDGPQNQRTCLVKPVGYDDDGGSKLYSSNPVDAAAPVCQPAGPEAGTIDASLAGDSGPSIPPLFPDAGITDAGAGG